MNDDPKFDEILTRLNANGRNKSGT